MKHLSLLTALMLSSSMVYAEWITEDYKGDCLEMMCDCVEKDGIGHCCPSGTSFNGKGDAHIEYTPCKCLGANTYYNTTSQKCLSKPTCNPCQKLNVATGTCVADTSKNNQAVGACGKCNNGSVITDTTKETVCKTCNTTNWTLTNRANGQAVGTCGKCNNGSVVTDTTKVTPCKTCDTTNWTLTNRANETQVQDVCHMCQNGKVVLKDSAKQFISNNTCVECLADYGTGKSGACTTEAKPLCQNNVCQACPAGQIWNGTSCATPRICTILYKQKNKVGNSSYISGECCSPDQKLVSSTGNTLFNGYDLNKTKYGCCSADKAYGDSKCCSSSQEPTNDGCCSSSKVYTKNGIKKCCDGTVSNNKTVCCTNKIITVDFQESYTFKFDGKVHVKTYSVGGKHHSGYCRVYLNGKQINKLDTGGHQETTINKEADITVKNGDRISVDGHRGRGWQEYIKITYPVCDG